MSKNILYPPVVSFLVVSYEQIESGTRKSEEYVFVFTTITGLLDFYYFIFFLNAIALIRVIGELEQKAELVSRGRLVVKGGHVIVIT